MITRYSFGGDEHIFVEVDEESGEVVVKSLLEDHQKIIAEGGSVAKSRTPEANQPVGEKRHTLNVKNQPVGKLILFLANKFEINLKIDPAVSDEQLKQLVSLSVKEVSSEELLQQIASNAGLRLEFGQRGALLKTK